MAVTAMAKVNFWNKVRVERNIRYKDLVELFGGSNGMWGMYFSGQQMPPINRIKQVCDFFDVDINEGAEEFRKAHSIWKAESKNKVMVTGVSEPRARSALIPAGRGQDEVEAKPTTHDYSSKDVFKLIYGKIPYELFLAFWEMVDSGSGDPMECLYGRVSYREYSQIADALKKVGDEDAE